MGEGGVFEVAFRESTDIRLLGVLCPPASIPVTVLALACSVLCAALCVREWERTVARVRNRSEPRVTAIETLRQLCCAAFKGNKQEVEKGIRERECARARERDRDRPVPHDQSQRQELF
jgi:hypothetical protein